jgi:hypothetical protein
MREPKLTLSAELQGQGISMLWVFELNKQGGFRDLSERTMTKM